MTEIEKAIEVIDMVWHPANYSDMKDNELRVDSNELNKACEMAVSALKKQKFFTNCKDCRCLEYIEDEYAKVSFCSKLGCYDVDIENDGCTFYEDWGDEQ